MRSIFASLFFLAYSIFAQNINLKDSKNQYDYVIITNKNFIPICETFKAHKENFNNFSVLITTRDQILSEFNTDSTIQDNIRNFISYAGTNWSDPKPKYFLFAADIDSIPNFVFRSVALPEYDDTSYSDYYYGVDTTSSDSKIISYSIGRVAARDYQELENYFNKVINYENNALLASWQNGALFVTDNQYGSDNRFEGDFFINIAKSISNELPSNINTNFIIPIDTSKYFGNTETIFNLINSGQSSIFFSGHAGNEVFTHESLLTVVDLSKLGNKNKPFFASMIGKQEFARGEVKSIINEMLVSVNGSIASINSVGIHYVAESANIYHNIWRSLYSQNSIGDIFIDAINSNSGLTEKRKYNIFGDPSLILKTDITSSVSEIYNSIPNILYLGQNYPNPFNPSTNINFNIPQNGLTTLKIYNVLGKEIATLVNENKQSGEYSVTFNASNLPSGIYFYTLSNGNLTQSKKMVFMK